MRGLDRIVSMRRQGFRPGYVAITDTPQLPGVLDDCQMEPSDVPELLDLRALFGLFVVIQGNDSAAVSRWADAAMKAGASTVLSQDQNGWTDHRLYGVDQ
jgi:hypothetical protein